MSIIRIAHKECPKRLKKKRAADQKGERKCHQRGKVQEAPTAAEAEVLLLPAAAEATLRAAVAALPAAAEVTLRAVRTAVVRYRQRRGAATDNPVCFPVQVRDNTAILTGQPEDTAEFR